MRHRTFPLALAALAVTLASTLAARPAHAAVDPSYWAANSQLGCGMSLKGMLGHAYAEAVRAQTAVSLSMYDMADNHLANVVAVLEDVDGDYLDLNTRDRLNKLRDRAEALKGQLDDRSTAVAGTSALVAAFSDFYKRVPAPRGRQGAHPPAMAAGELLGEAQVAAVGVQAALSDADWDSAGAEAQMLARRLVMASMAATQGDDGITYQDVVRIRQLSQASHALGQAIAKRAPGAARMAANLVAYIGAELPRIGENVQVSANPGDEEED